MRESIASSHIIWFKDDINRNKSCGIYKQSQDLVDCLANFFKLRLLLYL